jgi:FkbM family methyltransferase
MLRERVGPTGLVCAFEPAPTCYQALLTEQGPTLQIFNLALGDKHTNMALALADNPLGTTHSLVHQAGRLNQGVEVRVSRGDDVRRNEKLPLPNVIKIDVEGFEEEVIGGLDSTLGEPECRAVFCEVHFAILNQRGRRHAPSRIEETLKSYGFTTHWVDPSHLAALRV